MNRPTTDVAAGAATAEPGSDSRRSRLREFQAQLVERMQAVSTGAREQASQLGVLVGEQRWLLNLHEAGEIVSVGPIAEVPLTQAWFLGLANIRGNLVSVVDLAHFCGQPRTVVDKESRIVAFAPALSFNGGLLVSRVLGLRSLNDMEEYGAEAAAEPWAARKFIDRESNLWTELDLSRIVQDPRFLQVGR